MSNNKLTVYDTLPAYKGYATFYLLEYLSVQSGFDPSKHSHIKLKKDIEAYQTEFEEIFANTIFDYILTTSLGESRHAYKYCKDKTYLKATYEHSRSTIYSIYAHQYEPKNVIATLDVLFDKSWSKNFGGEKWRNAILACNLFYQNKKIFLDHCADLEHNCGSLFNKCYTVGNNNDSIALKILLDAKFLHSDHLPKHLDYSHLTYKIYNLLQRAKNLGIIAYAPDKYDKYHIESPTIKQWGTLTLEIKKQSKKQPKESKSHVKKETKKPDFAKPSIKQSAKILPGWLHTA